MRNLIATPSVIALMAATMIMGAAGQALADMSCPPGTLGPDCTAPTAPETDATLTASFHGAPDKHNGKKLFAFEIRFSKEFDGLRLPALRQALQVTGGRLVDVKRTVRGQNGGVTVRVRPASDADMTVTLAAGGSLASPISLTVPGPALTASFHGAPAEHDGKKLFAFEIRFSEEFEGMRLTALKQALQVTGGRLVDAKRTVRGQNRSVTVRVRPASSGEVTVTLPATADCQAAGAICTKAGRKLSEQASVSIGSATPQPVSSTVVVEPDSESKPETAASKVEEPPTFSDLPTPRNNLINTGTSDPSGLPNLTATNISTTVTSTKHTASRPGQPIEATWYTIEYDLYHYLRDGDEGHVNQVLNMNRLGIWGDFRYHDGSNTNGGPDIEVRFRQQGSQMKPFLLSDFATDSASDRLRLQTTIDGHVITVVDRWLTYPKNPGTNDTRVHVRMKTAAREDRPSMMTLANVLGDGSLGSRDWFNAEAHLVAPGSAVQPTAIGGQTSATWAGKVVAVNSDRGNLGPRGDVVGGDASVTVNFGASTTADVSLSNFRSTRYLSYMKYATLTWTGLTVSSGSFSDTSAGKEISGTFRQQGSTGNANTVGGVFEADVNLSAVRTDAVVVSSLQTKLKGGFVATRN